MRQHVRPTNCKEEVEYLSGTYILAGPVCRYLQYLHLQSISSPMAWVLTTLLLFLHLSSGWSVSIYTTLLSEHTLERRLDAGAIRKRVSYIPVYSSLPIYWYIHTYIHYVCIK